MKKLYSLILIALVAITMAKYNVSKSEAKRLGIERYKLSEGPSQKTSTPKSAPSPSSGLSLAKQLTSKGQSWGAVAEQVENKYGKIPTGSEIDRYLNSYYNAGAQQGPLMESGDFYSKAGNEEANQSIRSSREKAEKASSSKHRPIGLSVNTKPSPVTVTRPSAMPTPIKKTNPHNKIWDWLTGLNKDVSGLGGYTTGRAAPRAIEPLKESLEGLPEGGFLPGAEASLFGQPNEIDLTNPLFETKRQQPIPIEQPRAVQQAPLPDAGISFNTPSYNTPSYSTPSYSGGASSGGDLTNQKNPMLEFLQEQAEGDFGKKDAEKQMKNLLKDLGLEYDEYERKGKKDLRQAQRENLGQLSSMFHAAGTSSPDDEQMLQYKERALNKFTDQLNEYMAQLNTQRGRSVTDIKNQGMTAFQQVEDRKAQAQQQLANFMYQLQQDQADRQAQAAKVAAPKYDSANFYRTATQLKGQGTPWGDIAGTLGQNYDLTPGSDYSAQLDAIMTGQAPQGQSKLINLGNGMVLDQTTGDVFSVYE